MSSQSGTPNRSTCRLCGKSWSVKSGKFLTLIPKDSPVASNIESIIPAINSMFSSRFGRRYNLPEEACTSCWSKVNKIIDETVKTPSSTRSQRVRRLPKRLEDNVELKRKKRRVSSTPRKLTESPDSAPVLLRHKEQEKIKIVNQQKIEPVTPSQLQEVAIGIPAYTTDVSSGPFVPPVISLNPNEPHQGQVQVKTRKNISLLTNKEVLTVESVTMDGMTEKVRADDVYKKDSPILDVSHSNRSIQPQNLNLVGVSIQDILKAVDSGAAKVVQQNDEKGFFSDVTNDVEPKPYKQRKSTVKKISDKVWKSELVPEIDLNTAEIKTQTKPQKVKKIVKEKVQPSSQVVFDKSLGQMLYNDGVVVTIYNEDGEVQDGVVQESANMLSIVTNDVEEKSGSTHDYPSLGTPQDATNVATLPGKESTKIVIGHQLKTPVKPQHERIDETIANRQDDTVAENFVEDQQVLVETIVSEQNDHVAENVVTEQHETIIGQQQEHVTEIDGSDVHEEPIQLSDVVGEITEPVIATVEAEDKNPRFMVICPDGRTWDVDALQDAEKIVEEYYTTLDSKNGTGDTKSKDKDSKIECKTEAPEKSQDKSDENETIVLHQNLLQSVACKVDVETTSHTIESINTNNQEDYVRAKQEKNDGNTVDNDTIILESRPVDTSGPVSQTPTICVKIQRKELKELICPICDLQFVFRPELINHVLADHPDKVVLCKTCNQVFKTKEEMVQHVKLNHPKKACHVEGCMFIGKPHDVMRHGSVHTNEKNFQCGNCGNYFKSQNSLHNHIRIIHENSQVQKCLVCGKTFNRTASYQEHVASAHTKDKQYKCKICHQGFVSKHSWKRHENEYHCSPKYQCNICDKRFLHKGDVAKHKRTHDKETFKNVPCPVEDCNYKSYSKPLVWKHVIVTHMNIVKPRLNNINSSRRKFCSRCMQYVIYYDQHIKACEGLSEAELKEREEKSIQYAVKLDGIVKQVKMRTGAHVEEGETGLTMPGAEDYQEWSQLVKERVQLVQTGGFISFDVEGDEQFEVINRAGGDQSEPNNTDDLHVQDDASVIIDGQVHVGGNENSEWTHSNLDIANTEYVLVENDSGETMLVEKSCAQNVVVLEVNNQEEGTNDKEALEAAQVLCAMQP